MSSAMKPVATFGDWWRIETERDGTVYEPASIFNLYDIMREYPYLETDEIQLVEGKWGARMLAPGTMDFTDWLVCDTRKEALDTLKDLYGDDDDDDSDFE